MESFLPEKLVMVDLEMEGTDPNRDKILQVAMLKLKLQEDHYIQDGDAMVAYIHNEGRPSNDFQKEFLTPVYDICNQSTLQAGPELKEIIHDFLGEEYLGVATPVGDCVPCDIEFLYKYSCIDRPGYTLNGEPVKGTFHYEYFDLNSVKAIFRHKVGKKVSPPDLDTNIHDALVDCQNQLKELNFYLANFLES